MAFRKKAQVILDQKPDILIIPECECPANLVFAPGIEKPKDILWFGTNKHKGLGIFSFSNFRLTPMDGHNPKLRTIVPVIVTRGKFKLTLYAIWAYNPNDKDGQYVTQVWKAIHHYDQLLTNKNTILIGDFNSNSIWDKPRRKGNHSHVVERLGEKGIHSVYHTHFSQLQGKEAHPTFYLYKHQDKPYHLDYCFASKALLRKLKKVEIGDFNYWMQWSDHVPVIATFNMGQKSTQ